MSKDSEKRASIELDKTGEFFNVGAPLHAVRPGYVRRPADDLLFETLLAGNDAHVIAPDRTGKTSLIASTCARLQNNGFKVAVLDLEQISERDGGSDAGRWYYSIAYRLSRQLRLKTDLQTWWQDHSILSNRQRLVEFYSQVVLQHVQERIVVFIDEVQCVAELPFAEHLLASIRAAHNARSTEPAFNRLAFVVAGECDPHSLVDDPNLSPFIVSTEVRLNDFTRQDLNVFAAELNLSPAAADAALDRIFFWTSGQPYLSQKLARAVAREGLTDDSIDDGVDRLTMQQLAGRSAISSEPHMSHVHRAIVSDKKNYETLLTTYGQIRKGIHIEYDPESARHRRLLALGLVVTDAEGEFRIRNRIYESVFTAQWANENLPMHWRGPAIAALLFLALTAIPFAYTQLLPKPYLRVMSDPAAELETVSDAYLNLRSFPGHVEAADRMFRTVLENRARQATERAQMRQIAQFAAVLPDGLSLTRTLRSEFWDRQAEDAMRSERRDDALLASIESLVVSTQTRRRRAASLIDNDYPELIATVPARQADSIDFNAEAAQLTYISGADVAQWSVVGDDVTEREPWTIFALEVSPLLRRVIVDREGTANRIGLTVNVSHARLDDLRMLLISPSGRTAELTLDQPSSAANEEIRIPRSQLDSLMGESLNGTWTLSLRDESTGVTGHLMSWNLSLNSQVVVETFDRGLDIPDPVQRASDNLWLSADGRYAVARSLQSDSARVWDLNYAQPTRTIAVPASERVLGLSANAEYLVSMTQNTVNLWRASDGRRHIALELGASVSSTSLSGDGRHLLVTYLTDPDTYYEVWSLETGEVLAEMTIAGVPALQSVDSGATRLAVADYDRAVRIWDLREGVQLAQFDLQYQPTEMALSPNGEAMGVVFANAGVALWRIDQAEAPLLMESGDSEWHMAFSPSGSLFMAGSQRDGMQTYRTIDGVPTGPLIDPGLMPGSEKIFAFTGDEKFVVTAGVSDIARFWSMPAISADATQDAGSPDEFAWWDLGAFVSAVSPGGERLAFGDRSGHVHIELVDPVAPGTRDADDISFLGHQGPVRSMVFSRDGELVASAGIDGTIRIWDAGTGLPRSFYGRASVSSVERMAFSPNGAQLAVLGGQRIWLMATEDGAEIASIDLGEPHHDMAFAADDELYLGSESGSLRSLYPDRTGNWHLRNVWRGEAAIRRIDVAGNGPQIVIVDGRNQVRLLDPRDGRVSTGIVELPDAVEDVGFSPNGTRVLFRTGRWVHRALVTPGGLMMTDSVRGPRAMQGSGMVFDARRRDSTGASGDTVLVLARDTGVPSLVELRFSFADGPALFGSRTELLEIWADRIQGQAPPGVVREGYQRP